MKRLAISSWLGKCLPLTAGILLAGACARDGAPPPEKYATASAAVFANNGFETGAAGQPPPSWGVAPFINPNPNGFTPQTPQTRAGLNLMAGGVPLTVIMNAPGGPLTQPDAQMGAAASLRWPRYGNQCALVNNAGQNNNVNSMSQTMTVAAGDVDPADGLVHVRFVVAPVLENPGHNDNQQPYYMVQLTDLTTNTLLYSDFNRSAQPGVPWKTQVAGTRTFLYTDWQLVDITPKAGSLAMGDMVKLEVIAAGCSLGGHSGDVYVDAGAGPTVPGLFVSGTAPSQINLVACPMATPLTYTVTYHNGSASAETGVTVDFTTPPNTTFQSVTPPAGAICTNPGVGMAGTVTCTFTGPVPAGASGSFPITVDINCMATGTIVQGNYDIHSTTETPLLGSHIITTVGCTQDNECAAGQWCNETASKCTPTLATGQSIPVDNPHMNPMLTGMCTGPAATLVCTAKVCDTNNKCGYLNGDGPCTVGNGGVVCQSGVCDPDLKCGYPNGDGPCTMGNGSVVCRSGACSTNGLCEPAGGCNVDADCTGAQWCNEMAHVCTAKLTNGSAIPTDSPHMNPVLNGTCTAAAATLVCQSGVCDTTDNKCGFANSDGPCTPANGGTVCRSNVCDPDGLCGFAFGDGPCTILNQGTVCRSGQCSLTGVCTSPGACFNDSECTGGNWCNETAHMCTPKLANGIAIPTDSAHTTPTINGMCTPGAGALVCTSGVCDTNDNECGFANNDGPCTMVTGTTVCRSGNCTLSGVCEPTGGCTVDTDCTAGNWCNETAHMCTPQLDNGTAIPTDSAHTNPTIAGTCTPGAGAVVCKSLVCDTNDNKCGYANNDGPCTMGTAMTVCRSGACSLGGTCVPAGGCNVDSDCAMGKWCDETAHMCTPQLANGTAIPTDPPHSSPTLNGTCTMAAGSLVCVSLVCDTTDNKCGFANGDGPCTMANGMTICRSGNCATTGPNNGKCVQCLTNTQCMNNEKCDPTTNTCVGCITDSDCGGPMSGMVCGMGECKTGCRGTGGNGCPTGDHCTSMDNTIGQCIMDMTTSSTASTTSTGTDMSSSSATGSGAGGGSNGGTFVQGHGIFGCSIGGGVDGTSSIAGALGLLWLTGRRRRTAKRSA